LREALSEKGDSKLLLPEWMPAFLIRASSDATTCMGSSPESEGSASPPVSSSPFSECVNTPALEQAVAQSSVADTSQDAQAPRRSPCWWQARKVFVGGIPQSVDQKELQSMFNKVAKVKKAWLQHDHEFTTKIPGARKHRGFGFVVFSEKDAADKLLGEDSSRFVTLGDGLKLEIKRAVDRLSTPDVQNCGTIVKTSSSSSVGSSHVSRTASPQVSPASQQSRTSSHGSQTTSPQMMPVPVQFQAYTLLPCVPAFPASWNPMDVHASRGDNATVAMAMPLVAHYAMRQPLSNTLLDGFVGQMPRNQQELESVLRQALPDCYED